MTDRLALAAAGVSVLLWSSAFVGIRAAGRDLSPGALSLARLLIGSLLLGLLVAYRRPALPPRRDLVGIIITGVLWFGLYNILLNQAERQVDAGTAAMLVNIAPVLLAVLSGIFLHEGFPRRLMAGCAVAFAGTVIIGVATSPHAFTISSAAWLCVGAAAAYAVAIVIQKPLMARSSALMVTWLACTTGAVVCLPFSAQLWAEAPHAAAGSLAWAVYLGAAPTAIGFSTWGYALARTDAGRLGATTYLVPSIAVLMGWLILGDLPPLMAFAGGALCLLGVAVSRGLRFPRGRFGRERTLNR
ncbi:MAG: DMT family transporter [Candidatus Dormibacteria bacterium]